jgi:hypothetical protein
MTTNKRTKLEVGKTYKIVFTTRYGITEAEVTIGEGKGATTVRQAHGYISSWLAFGNTTAEITEVS